MKEMKMGNTSIEEHVAKFKMLVTKLKLEKNDAVVEYFREILPIPLQKNIMTLRQCWMVGIAYPAGPRVGYSWVWVQVLIWLPTRNPYPQVPVTHIYWAGFLNLEMAGGHTTHSTNARHHHELYSSIPATIYVYLHAKKTPHLFCDSCIHPIAMPRDEVDPSTITNEP